MINFSDIFGEEKGKYKKKKETRGIDFSSLEKDRNPLNKDKSEEAISQDKIPRVSSQEEKEAEELYKHSVLLAEKIFNSDVTASSINEIRKFVKTLVAFSKNTNQVFFEYVFGRLPYEVDFMPLNLVNVCILAIEVGEALGYNDSQLVTLGVGAFLHDIGMRQFGDLFSQPRNLTDSEKQRIKKHPLIGVEKMKFIQAGLEPLVLEIIEQEHERADGSGYPHGLKKDEINEFPQIVGLVDVYEALTHRRPYRNSYSPLEAIKIILREKNLFNPRITKAFLEKIGLYPKGTFVELNTKEIAQVINQNRQMPSCPYIRVVYDYEGRKLDKSKEIDLSKNTKIYIVRSL